MRCSRKSKFKNQNSKAATIPDVLLAPQAFLFDFLLLPFDF
jgi:hypothetical protein